MEYNVEDYIKLKYNNCLKADNIEDKKLYYHQAFGAVEWEQIRTGTDLTEFWSEWRDKFIFEIWGF